MIFNYRKHGKMIANVTCGSLEADSCAQSDRPHLSINTAFFTIIITAWLLYYMSVPVP